MKLKNKGKRIFFLTLFAIPVLLLFHSCASKPPQILQLTWNIYAYRDRINSVSYEALSLFLNLNDPDGIDDIEKIYLINDTKELFWKLDDTNWIKKKVGSATWIGSNKIVTTDRNMFPRGNYRIMVYDLGGNSAETSLSVDTPIIKIARIIFPTATIKGTMITLNERGNRVTGPQIWIYQDKKFIMSYPFKNRKIQVESLIKNKQLLANGFEFELYSYSPRYKIHLLTGPFYFERATTNTP